MTFSSPHPHPPLAIPGVWRAADLAPHRATTPTGFQALDKALPGNGWPQASLTAVHSPRPGLEWRLLDSALQAASGHGVVLLVAPPHRPHLGALVAMGVHMPNLWWVEAPQTHEMAWVVERALRCTHLAAVLFWPTAAWPRATWQRLQQACALATATPPPLVFALCHSRATLHQSRAPLQLALTSLGAAGLQVAVVKKAGPPLAHPLVLHAPLAALPSPMGTTQTRSQPANPTQRHVVDRSHAHAAAHAPTP